MRQKIILCIFFIGLGTFKFLANDTNLVKSLMVPDDMKNKYYAASSTIEGINALNDICFYLNNVDPDQSGELSKYSLRVSDSLNYLTGLYDANNNIGISFYRTAKYQQALSCFRQAEEFAKILGDKGKEAAVLSNIALVYTDLSDYDKALIFNNKALRIRSIKKDTSAIAISYNNIGMCYHHKGDYPDALAYYYKALELKKDQYDKDGIANTANNIGQLFIEMYFDSTKWALDSALIYFLQAYNFYSATSNHVGLAKVLLNIANVYANGSDNEKALNAYRAALNAQKFINDSAGLSLSYFNMGQQYLSLDDLEMSENHFQKSLNVAERLGLTELKRDNFKQLFIIYNKKGDFRAACSYADQLIVVDECIDELSRITLIDQYNGKYEYQVFENMNLQKSVTRTQLWLIIITIIALSLSGLIVVWHFVKKKQ